MLTILALTLNNFTNAHVFSILWIILGLGLFYVYQRYLQLKNKFWESAIIFISAFFLLLLSYAPLINSYFVFHDDYAFWSMQKGVCNTHAQYLFFLTIGRPIANVFLCPLRSMISDLDSGNFIRLISILFTSIIFFIINRYLIYMGFKKLISYGIALIIVTGFAFHVYNTWIIAFYIFPAIIFSIFSVWLAEKVTKESSQSVSKGNSNNSFLFINNRNLLLLIFSIIFYILTLSTYQQASGFFACFAAVSFLKDKKINTKFILFKSAVFGGIFLISNALYLFSLRILVFSYDNFHPQYDPTVIDNIFSRILERLIWFVKIPFLNSFNIISIESNILTLSMIALFIFSVIILFIKDLSSTVNFANRNELYFNKKFHFLIVVYKYIIVTLCIPLSYHIMIVSSNTEVNYRTLAPLMVFILLTIIIAIELVCEAVIGKTKFFRNANRNLVFVLLIAVVCAINLLNTNLRLQTLTMAYSSEVQYIKYRINSIPQETIQNLKAIEVITHSNQPPILSRSISELNVYSSAFPQDIVHILACAFSEVSSSQRPKAPPIVSVYNSSGQHLVGPDLSSPENATISNDHKLVLNMNDLNLF